MSSKFLVQHEGRKWRMQSPFEHDIAKALIRHAMPGCAILREFNDREYVVNADGHFIPSPVNPPKP